jgi:hypothetical protein
VSISPASPDGQVLSRELSEFLLDFLGAQQRFSMYPVGHPLLDPAVDSLTRRLNTLFLERGSISLAVTPTQLVVSGVPTDPDHTMLRELAGKLHRRNLGGVKVFRGVNRTELASFLAVIGTDASDAQQIVTHDEPTAQWPHIRLFGLAYDKLALLDEEDEETTLFDPLGGSWAGRLWLGLARASMGEHLSDDAAAKVDPEEIAKAINEHQKEARRDERVITALTDLAEACQGRGRTETIALQRQLSRLIGSLTPETLERLMHMGGDQDRRRKWLFQASKIMTADVIVTLVEAAAHAQQRSVSPAMLQLLSKLSNHVDQGPPKTRLRAEQALRKRIRAMISRWSLSDLPYGSPGYDKMLESLPGGAADFEPVLVYGPEPQRIIMTCLELGVVQAGTRRAVDRMVENRETGLLLDLLERVPADKPAVSELRGWVLSRSTVSRVLAIEPIDIDTLARLVKGVGIESLPTLLDALSTAKERKVRARLMDIITHLGPAIGPDVVGRISGAPWFVQRNLLRLLGMLPELPEGFSLASHVKHNDPRVRHEALRIMLRDRVRRPEALKRALEAPDPPTVRLGIMAAAEGCPPNIAPMLLQRIHSGGLDPQVRAVAIRAVASVDNPNVIACLLGLTQIKGTLGMGRKLAPKSPELLAALQGLAAHWPYHAEASKVLDLTQRSKDPEIRKAGTPPTRQADPDAQPAPTVPRVII